MTDLERAIIDAAVKWRESLLDNLEGPRVRAEISLAAAVKAYTEANEATDTAHEQRGEGHP